MARSPTPTPSPAPSAPPPPWQPRFTIFGMMLTMVLVGVAAAAVGYLVRNRDSHFGTLIFLLITLAGPLVVMIVISIASAVATRLNRPARRKKSRES